MLRCPRPTLLYHVFVVRCRSGSTSEPKGVMITHANLADNLKLIVTGLSAVDDTVVVGWLPQVTDGPSHGRTTGQYISRTWEQNTCEGLRSAIGGTGKIVFRFWVDVPLYVRLFCSWGDELRKLCASAGFFQVSRAKTGYLSSIMLSVWTPSLTIRSDGFLFCWCARCCVHWCFRAAFVRS